MKITAVITLKDEVTDTHGAGVLSSLKLSGFDTLNDVRYGKLFTVILDETDPDIAKKMVEDMCEKLLTNPYIEKYTVFVDRVLQKNK